MDMMISFRSRLVLFVCYSFAFGPMPMDLDTMITSIRWY